MDELVRVIAHEAHIRALCCRTTQTVQEACSRHQTWPTASVALGRALTGGALMGALLKGRQRVALKFEGHGPLGKILVEADSLGRVHGYVGNPQVDLPLVNGQFDLPGALGRAGLLTVTKDLLLREPYKGVVNLVSSEIAEDLAYYLTDSEQIPSAVGLTTMPGDQGQILVAGGFLLQPLPSASEAALDQLEAGLEALPPLSKLFFDGATPEEILAMIFGDISFEVLGHQEVSFVCSCSRERLEQALITLGPKDTEDLVQKETDVEVVCEFCRQAYIFTPEELFRLFHERH